MTTTIDVQTRISDLYRSPMDQVREQLGVLVEMMKERQENELINNASYGFLSNAAPSMRVSTMCTMFSDSSCSPPEIHILVPLMR